MTAKPTPPPDRRIRDGVLPEEVKMLITINKLKHTNMNWIRQYWKDLLMLIGALAIGITAVLTAGSLLSWILVAAWVIIWLILKFAKKRNTNP